MPDDYARKQYNDKSYPDWMRSMPAKAIWNQVLESNPGIGEYASSIRSTPLSRSIQRYIQQSDFKKPYLDNDFVNMEQEWEGPGGGTQYRPGKYDNPWNIRYPKIAGLPSGRCYSIFDAEVAGCWCEGQAKTITITGTNPISALTMTFSAVGTTLVVLDGLGTNSVTAELTASSNQSGYVTIEASMSAFCETGPIPGDSSVNVYECRECCSGDCSTFINDAAVTPETIARSTNVTIGVTGGTGPYAWVLTQPNGLGFTIDAIDTQTNTLYASAAACGSCDIEVTDACACVTTFNVRCTTGSWSLQGTGAAYCGGCEGPPYCADSRNSGWAGSIPSKSCYPTNCKYYFLETTRRTVAVGYTNANRATCEASRAAATCSGSDCTYYGASGMYCAECVGRWDYQACVIGAASVPAPRSTPPALYKQTECFWTGSKWGYCRYCYQSYILRKYIWRC